MSQQKQYVEKVIPGAGSLSAYQQNGENQNPARYIPDDSYTSARDLIQRVDPTRNGPATYPRHRAVEHLLLTVLDVLDVTKYQLGKILGCKHESQVFQRFNGYRRPEPLYPSRMCHALLMGWEPNGLPISLISSIDWEMSEITWRSGVTTKDNHFFPDWNVVRKKKAKKGIPHLTGGVTFHRSFQELPEQRVIPGRSEALL
tara:strand:+ start:194 stop:796 length:603 start_codon:yes stop_codon:yes gene_type:complete